MSQDNPFEAPARARGHGLADPLHQGIHLAIARWPDDHAADLHLLAGALCDPEVELEVRDPGRLRALEQQTALALDRLMRLPASARKPYILAADRCIQAAWSWHPPRPIDAVVLLDSLRVMPRLPLWSLTDGIGPVPTSAAGLVRRLERLEPVPAPPVGTGRIRMYDDDTTTMEHVIAVLEGLGLGWFEASRTMLGIHHRGSRTVPVRAGRTATEEIARIREGGSPLRLEPA